MPTTRTKTSRDAPRARRRFGLLLRDAGCCLACVLLQAPCGADEAAPAQTSRPIVIQISAPATQALAAIGLGILAVHLLRRRQDGERRPPAARPSGQDEAEWQRRLALWEERLGGDDTDAGRTARDGPERRADPADSETGPEQS
jgi:hypothetical protein